MANIYSTMTLMKHDSLRINVLTTPKQWISNDIMTLINQDKPVLLVILGLSAGCDAVDLDVLVSRLEDMFKFIGWRLNFRPIWNNAHQKMSAHHMFIAGFDSWPFGLLGVIILLYGVKYNLYDDDAQLSL